MQPVTLIALLALAVSASVAQQYSGNYVESDYDYQEPAPRHSPPARSYSRPAPAPVRQSQPSGPRPTPVPILKQINRHNDDGSYTYGYEGADGSFKIETKLHTGEVMGKYGYVDDVGKVRVVEYGANKYGFQPSGEGITVAPPTLVDETRNKQPGNSPFPEYDDGQYYQAPAPSRPASRPAPRLAPRPAPPPPPQQQSRQQFSYDSYQDEQDYSDPRPQSQPRLSQGPPPRLSQGPPPRLSQGPAPPRAVVPGASPSGPQTGVTYAQSRPAPPPSRPAPVYQGPPPSRPRPAPQARHANGGGILDQLAQDYALPQGGGSALTDISFSSY